MTYTYECKNCGKEFEMVQSIKDEPLKICVHCNSNNIHRLIDGGAGFVLKGTGWASDGYSNK
jgi:putative FmdB family regulatory protein